MTDDNIIQGPWNAKKPTKAAPKASQLGTQISLSSAFANPEYEALKEIGINYFEKPSGFDSLLNSEKHVRYDDVTRARIKKALGRTLNAYDIQDVLLRTRGFYYPQSSFRDEPIEDTFIIHTEEDLNKSADGRIELPAGSAFLCNRTGAKSYIRMWLPIVFNQ